MKSAKGHNAGGGNRATRDHVAAKHAAAGNSMSVGSSVSSKHRPTAKLDSSGCPTDGAPKSYPPITSPLRPIG